MDVRKPIPILTECTYTPAGRAYPPSEWEKMTGVRIIDPDGWRIDNKDFGDLINEYEWNQRMMRSTVGPLQTAAGNGVKEVKNEPI